MTDWERAKKALVIPGQSLAAWAPGQYDGIIENLISAFSEVRSEETTRIMQRFETLLGLDPEQKRNRFR